MRKVNISELKAKLASYLRHVRNGETVEVLDRNTPIALITGINDVKDSLRTKKPSSGIEVLFHLSKKPKRRRSQHDVVQTLVEDRKRR